jgi:hypothetical protein
MENTDLSARTIAEKSLKIAGQICIYTNDQITIEELTAPASSGLPSASHAGSSTPSLEK